MNGKRKREEKNSGSMQVTFLLIKKLFFLKMGHPRPLLSFHSVFSNKHYNFYNICGKMSAQ